MWRPDRDWRNPFNLIGAVSNPTEVCRNEKHFAFEAGADAMLKSLRADGFRAESIRDIKIPEPSETLAIPTFKKMKDLEEVNGYWVFIPDEG